MYGNAASYSGLFTSAGYGEFTIYESDKVKYYFKNNNTWSVLDINSKKIYPNITSGAPASIPLKSGEKYQVTCVGYVERTCAMFLVYVNNNGVVAVTEVIRGESISVSTSTNTLIISNSNSSYSTFITCETLYP